MTSSNASFLLPNVQESPRCLVARGEKQNAPKGLENVAWMNVKDSPDGVLMTPIDHKTSKSDASSDHGIIKLLTQATRSRIRTLIVFGIHGLIWTSGYGQGLLWVLNSIMLGVSLQVWYGESIPLEQTYSVRYTTVLVKIVVQFLRKKKLQLSSLFHALQCCQWATMSNEVCHYAETKRS